MKNLVLLHRRKEEERLRPLRIIISGGGTGGHIFPAVAIANALKAKVPAIEILFIGALGRMEMEKVPAAGYKIEGLWISGLQRKKWWKNFSFPFKILSSLIKAKKILKKFKPHAVIGTGGYASGPMLRVASGRGIPTLIQEQNSYPGITNKLLAKKADRICVAYEGMEKFFPKEKILLTGNPVRQDILELQGKRNRAMEAFKLEGGKKTILVIGGSLGAGTINESIAVSLEQLIENKLQLIWQTGKTYYETAKMLVKKYDTKGIRAVDFISKMDYAYAAADAVVSRAGAISVSELCLVRKAVILIPSPNVAEDHQTKNAMTLVNHRAAILIKDSEAKENLGKSIVALMNNKEQIEQLENNIAKLAFRNSADVIASEVLRLINR